MFEVGWTNVFHGKGSDEGSRLDGEDVQVGERGAAE